MSIDKAWHRAQVEAYSQVQHRYEAFCEVLLAILREVISKEDPEAIVQARAKALDSFAEKCIRKHATYTDPVNDLTDLCGSRVIAHTQSQVYGICDRIERLFDIDWPNSEDVKARLKTGEFGYLSVHYIVRLNPLETYGEKVQAVVEQLEQTTDVAYADLDGLSAEVQVRTLLQHAWADIIHDRVYKNEFKVPRFWHREVARMAANLENADQSFERFASGVDSYRSYFGAYMTAEQMASEIELLRTILAGDRENKKLSIRLARIAHAAQQ